MKRRLLRRVVMCASLAALVFAGLTVASRVSPLRAARFILRSVDTVDEMCFLRGKSVRWRILDLLYATGILRPVQVLVAPGFAMNVDRIDYVTRDILMTGIWEPHITGITMAALKEGDVFFDIGAHVGYYTLLASTLVGTSGKVIALEPNPPTADRLRANIQLNKFTNISVYQAAAADNEGSLPFFQAGNEHNAWSSLSKVNALGGREIVVKSLRLDSIANIESLTRVDLMKLDVEGAEMQVLRGARQILTTFGQESSPSLSPGRWDVWERAWMKSQHLGRSSSSCLGKPQRRIRTIRGAAQLPVNRDPTETTALKPHHTFGTGTM